MFRLSTLIMCLTLVIPALAAPSTTVIPEVNARKTFSAVKKPAAPLQVTHLTRKDIVNSPVVSFADLLKQQQSIVRLTNNSSDSSQTMLSIRGFGDNAVANSLILIDGFPLTNPSLLAPNLNSIVLSDIERIDILQGSEGTLWGDQAVGGVVNIITRHPGKGTIEAEVGLGRFNKQFYNVYVSKKLNSGLFLKLFGFTNQTNQYRQHNRQTDASLNGQIGLDYSRGLVYLNIQSFDNSIEFPGGLTEAQFHHHPRLATNNTNAFHYQTNVYQVLNKHELNENWVLETRLMHKKVVGNGRMSIESHLDETMNSINPLITGVIGQSKVVLGYAGQFTHYRLFNRLANNDTNAQQNNLYAQTIIPASEAVDVTLGARSAWQYNEIGKESDQRIHSTDKTVVTEQGVSFHPNTAWQFYLRRDGNFRFPKANEEAWTLPNVQSLQLQTGVSYEAGTTWQTALQRAQLSLYQLKLYHEIAFNPIESPLQPFGAFQNFDHTIRRGITLTDTYQLSPVLEIDGQINGVYARFASGIFKGNDIPAVPTLNGNLGLNYHWTSQWKTKLTALYTGSRYASEDVANVGKQLPGYWIDTVTLQYVKKNVQASFEIGNVLNQSYSAYTRYDPDVQANIYYPGVGRSYLFTLKASIE